MGSPCSFRSWCRKSFSDQDPTTLQLCLLSSSIYLRILHSFQSDSSRHCSHPIPNFSRQIPKQDWSLLAWYSPFSRNQLTFDCWNPTELHGTIFHLPSHQRLLWLSDSCSLTHLKPLDE